MYKDFLKIYNEFNSHIELGMNKEIQIFLEEGKEIQFKINMEDVDEGVYIAASGVRCNIFDENPFINIGIF